MHPLYIEINEEITTVIERLKEAPETAVALVIPKGSPLIQSIVNLKLAKKAAADSGKELVIVSTDKIGKNLAGQVGIPVVARIEEGADALAGIGETEVASGSEPNIIDGVKIRRYYDQDGEEPTQEKGAQPEPIIPRAIMKEETKPDSPITVRTISAASAADSKSSTPEVAPLAPLAATVVEDIAAAGPIAESAGLIETLPEIETAKPEAAVAFAPLPESSESEPKRSRRAFMFALYLLVLLLLGATGVGAFYLPQTKVSIAVASQEWSQDLVLTAKTGSTTLPAELVTSELEETITFNATGTKDLGEKARGSVKIYNGSSTSTQTLPAGTVISANNLNFITDAAVTVPGYTQESGKSPVFGSATVQVTAEKAGADGNVANAGGKIVSPQTSLLAQDVNTAGGTTKQVAVITQTDIANARTTLTKQAREKAEAKLVEGVQNREILFDSKTDSFTFEAFSTSAGAGTESETATATAKATLKRLIVDKAKVRDAALAQLKDIQDKEKTYSTESIDITATEIKMADQSAAIATTSKGRSSATLPIEQIREKLVGKKRADGETVLKDVTPEGTITIEQQPAWWPIKNFPYSDKYLQVEVKYE